MATRDDRTNLALFQAAQARERNRQNQAGALQQVAQTKQKQEKAKKADEALRRTLIRPAQASLFSGSVIGSPTFITLILGGSLWSFWKGIEGYKTITGSSVGIFEKFVVSWNFREALTFFCGAALLGIVTIIIVGIFGLIGYYLLNPLELLGLVPSLGSIFKTLF